VCTSASKYSLKIHNNKFQGNKIFLISWIGITTLVFVVTVLLALGILFSLWDSFSTVDTLKIFYLVVYSLITLGYSIQLTAKCLPYFGIIDELTPIGKGTRFIVEYYEGHAKEAAALLLMLEIVSSRLGNIYLSNKFNLRYARLRKIENINCNSSNDKE
jgi:hypothetical protein